MTVKAATRRTLRPFWQTSMNPVWRSISCSAKCATMCSRQQMAARNPSLTAPLPGTRIYLKPPNASADTTNAPADPPATQQAPARSLDREVWETIRDTSSPGVLKAFINKFPDSIYAELAKARLKEVRQAALAKDPPAPTQSDNESSNSSDSNLPNGSWAVVAGSFPRSQKWKADQRRDELRQVGVWAKTVNTNDYRNLRNGLWAVIIGPTTRSGSQSPVGRREEDHRRCLSQAGQID